MSQAVPPILEGLDYIQPLGSGGYADVYLYEQQMPRMKVAVKVLKTEGLTPAIKQQFIDEANTMAQLADHPYIVQVFRAGTSDDGRPFLVMKYYPPPNLAQRARAERFSVEEVLRTGIQLASAVETAHRAGVIHRDIKPANVLVSQYGSPGLTDFGIAGRGGALEDLDDDIGVSVPWAPPEVLYGQSNGDARADVYSLAATMWQLLVGRSPFEVPGGDNSAYALMPRIRSNPPPSTERPDVPASLERLLAQAMGKNPLARPATALELARSLQHVEQQERYARTAIVVLDEEGHTGSARSTADTTDRTRARTTSAPGTGRNIPPPPLGQPVIGGELSGGRSIPGSAPVSFSSPGARSGPVPGYQSGPSGPVPGYQSGPSGARPPAPTPQTRAEAGSSRAPKAGPLGIPHKALLPIAGIGAALLVLLVGLGGWAVLSGSGDDPTTTGGTTDTTDGSPTPASLPGTPTITEMRKGDKAGRVVVAVSMDGFTDNDIVQVRAKTEQASSADDFSGQTWMSAPAGSQEFVTSALPGDTLCAIAKVVRDKAETTPSEVKCWTVE